MVNTTFIVDVFDDFISSLDFSTKVLALNNDGVNTDLKVENVYHARAYGVVAGTSDRRRVLKVDGNEYPIISVNYADNEITVEGVILTAQTAIVQTPFYFHGTPIDTAMLVDKYANDESVPMIYLSEVIKENHSLNSVPTFGADLSLFFMDSVSYGKNITDTIYAEAVTPMRNLVNAFLASIAARVDLFESFGVDYSVVNYVKWGYFRGADGNSKKVFNKELAGIEVRFRDLKFWYKNNCC